MIILLNCSLNEYFLFKFNNVGFCFVYLVLNVFVNLRLDEFVFWFDYIWI